MAGSPPSCVLFDLDGTLVDTAPDLALALNRLREAEGLAALPYQRVRPVVSHGAAGLLRLGFALESEDAAYPALRRRLLTLYSAALADHSVLFQGMDTVLERLESTGVPWGVVTNKPGWLTEPLMARLGLARRAACLVSGDTAPAPKPDPAPLLHACRTVGVAPGGCLYVGDAERDVVAGRRAGMGTLVAGFGYIDAHEAPGDWGADGILDRPEDLLAWLGPMAGPGRPTRGDAAAAGSPRRP